ncbi:hypothetical protein QAD02_015017 [Eretmocerus hayati]|uniref:Uncharacterized protein n=1 Tax=Eretmocerus hayati TaxID=131215 RepID=A0ACC2PBV2_9HYME|nr:hypothetical protein QAD02_015017 [Eretmocerus hayati]
MSYSNFKPLIERICEEVQLRAVIYDKTLQDSHLAKNRIETAFWEIASKVSTGHSTISPKLVQSQWEKKVSDLNQILMKRAKAGKISQALKDVEPYMQFMLPHLGYDIPESIPITKQVSKKGKKKGLKADEPIFKDIKSHYVKVPDLDPHALPQQMKMNNLQNTLEDLSHNFQKIQNSIASQPTETADDYFTVIFPYFKDLPSSEVESVFCELLGLIRKQLVQDQAVQSNTQ